MLWKPFSFFLVFAALAGGLAWWSQRGALEASARNPAALPAGALAHPASAPSAAPGLIVEDIGQ